VNLKKGTVPISVLTTGRQDWGLLRPLVDRLVDSPVFDVLLLAGGMACSRRFGRIVDLIRSKGYPLARELAWDVEQAPAHVQSAQALRNVGDALAELTPTALVLLGDRFETASAALAATTIGIPIVHLHGGEETEGAIDNVLRHAITKLSHLHLVAHETYARRVIQMGEDPSTVYVVGSLGVDNVLHMHTPGKEELERYLGIELVPPVGLVTVHPTTLPDGASDTTAQAVAQAIGAMRMGTWVITLPNSDPGNEKVRKTMIECAAKNANAVAVEALGEERYIGLMRIADLVLGNSSSGMIEAPAMGVPTVNVGARQRGRLRFPSVFDVDPVVEDVVAGIRTVLAEGFLDGASGAENVLGGGRAAGKSVQFLEAAVLQLERRKHFHELPVLSEGEYR